MIMEAKKRGKSMGSGKNNLVSGDYKLGFGTQKGCINGSNGLELGINVKMTIFCETFPFNGN
jgi:hypothetical protein